VNPIIPLPEAAASNGNKHGWIRETDVNTSDVFTGGRFWN